MTGGFGAVPEELFKAASTISDAVGNAASLVWNGPSGDYGHPGVQDGWTQFIADLKSAVDDMTRTADAHSENLKSNATNYNTADEDATSAIGKAAAGLESHIGSILGGLGGSGGSDGSLAVPGATSGGFTGNLTRQQLDQREGGQH